MTTGVQFAATMLPSLLRARGEKGLSRGAVADTLNVRYTTFAMWERGQRTPSAEDARRWATLLGVPWPEGAERTFRRQKPGLQPCGTRAAFQRHVRHDEEPCPPCRAADNDYHQRWVTAQRLRRRYG